MLENVGTKSAAMLRQAAKERGYTLDELARIALIPHTTFFRRLVKPDDFTIGNLRDMFDALCLDAGDALDIVADLLWEGGEAHG